MAKALGSGDLPDSFGWPMRLVGAFWYRFAQVVVGLLALVYWRMPIIGKENLPDGPFIFAPVHRSNLDGPLCCIATRRRMRFVAKREMFGIHWLSRVFFAMGAIPVDRGKPDRASLEMSLRELGSGVPLVLFPEGGRKSGFVVKEIHEGAAYLAMKAKVPVVPVGIGGSEFANPPRSAKLLPKKLAMVIGAPLDTVAFLPEEGRPRREHLDAFGVALHEALQVVFDEALAKSRTSTHSVNSVDPVDGANFVKDRAPATSAKGINRPPRTP